MIFLEVFQNLDIFITVNYLGQSPNLCKPAQLSWNQFPCACFCYLMRWPRISVLVLLSAAIICLAPVSVPLAEVCKKFNQEAQQAKTKCK